MTALIEADDVCVSVARPRDKPLVVVDHAHLAIEAGRSYAIVGKSGAGKTSLLSVLGLLNAKYSGRVTVTGQDVAKLSDARLAMLRARQIGFVFQNYSLVPHLSVLANVLLPCWSAKVPRKTALAHAKQALSDVGLGDRLGAKPMQLSGGEQQRVAIARAMVNQPQVVMADEPTGALDTDTGAAVMTLLMDRVKNNNIALLVVTHDTDISSLCGTKYVMARGRLEVAPTLPKPISAKRAERA